MGGGKPGGEGRYQEEHGERTRTGAFTLISLISFWNGDFPINVEKKAKKKKTALQSLS